MHQFTEEEQNIASIAEQHVKSHKKQIVLQYTSTVTVDARPISIFMAGSPGAGKTEYSKEVETLLTQKDNRSVVRIDPDEIRATLPGYEGDNAYIFQKAATIAVHEIHSAVLKNKQNFILDGTLANYTNAELNISRSLDKIARW